MAKLPVSNLRGVRVAPPTAAKYGRQTAQESASLRKFLRVCSRVADGSTMSLWTSPTAIWVTGKWSPEVVLTERRRVNSAGTRPVVRETACGSGQWETGAAKVVKTRERILGYSRAGCRERDASDLTAAANVAAVRFMAAAGLSVSLGTRVHKAT